jgi:hypothetical protein
VPGSVPTFRATWHRAASWSLSRLAAGCSRAESGTRYRRRVSPKSKLSRLGKLLLGTLPQRFATKQPLLGTPGLSRNHSPSWSSLDLSH